MPIISDDTEVARLGREDPYDLILEEIGILILIDHEVLEAIMEVLEYLRYIEHLAKEEQQIVKIKCIRSLQSTIVFFVDFEYDTLDI